jgi:hypothetical protein
MTNELRLRNMAKAKDPENYYPNNDVKRPATAETTRIRIQTYIIGAINVVS